MKNFKRHMWSKIFFIFSMFSFVTFLNTTNALAQAASDHKTSAPAPAIEGGLSDLGGEDEALLEGEDLPSDEATDEELLGKLPVPQGAAATAAPTGIEVTAVPAEGIAPAGDIFSGPPTGGEEPNLGELSVPAPGIPAELASPEVELPESDEAAVSDASGILGEAAAPAEGEVLAEPIAGLQAEPLIEGDAPLLEGEAPADLATPVGEEVGQEETFVLASVEEQEALKTEVADLLLEVDPETASIIQDELSTAINDGTIVLGGATGTDAATDAQATLSDEALATVAKQLATSTDAQKAAVLNNLTQLTKTLQTTAPATLGTGTAGTATASPEALKSIGAMEQAIKSGNQKAIAEAMKSAAEVFRAFGPEMGMGGFGGPQGEFAGPIGSEGGHGFDFFDRAFAGALPEEMMKTFSEGPGMGFDRGRMAAEGFMADVGTHMIARMAGDSAPADVFRAMGERGLSPEIMMKAAEQFSDALKNNPDAFRGPMGGGPMEGGFGRGPEGFSGGPQGGWGGPETFAGLGGPGHDTFRPGATPEIASVISPRETFAIPRDYEQFFRGDQIDHLKAFIPPTSTTSTTSTTATTTPPPPLYLGDPRITAAINTVTHNANNNTHTIIHLKEVLRATGALNGYNNIITNSPSVIKVSETADVIVIVWTSPGLLDPSSRNVTGTATHVNEPAPAPRQVPTDAEVAAAEVKLHYENFRVTSGQTAGQNFVAWVGDAQRNYPSQAVRDAIRDGTQSRNQAGQPHVTSAGHLAAKRAAITQLKADIAEARVPNCHSLSLHNDVTVAAEHSTLTDVHCP